jgi:hypothetical protein
MRPLPETIKLGDHAWKVRPLTLRQIQEIEPILMANAGDTKGTIAAAIAIVAVALRRDHAEAASSISNIEATAPEIGTAMETVLRLGGFVEKSLHGGAGLGEALAGEVPRATPPASISPLSTQG